MKTTTLARNGVSAEMVDLISRLVDLIPWPTRVRRIGRALISAAHCAACVFNRPIIRRNALRLFTPHILGSRHEPLPACLLTWHAWNAALLLPLGDA